MSNDAKNSTGVPASLTGEKLKLMKQMSELATSTYPPKFTGKPYDGPVDSDIGNEALKRGQWAHANRKKAPQDSGSTGHVVSEGFPSVKEMEEELGGVEGMFVIFGLHYVGMFANPRMNVLFDTRDKDSAASAMDHGKRICSTLLDAVFGTRYFASLGRGFSGAFAVMGTHAKAKRCPMRPKTEQVELPRGHRKANRRFTTKQRDSWVGHIMIGCEQCACSEKFQKKLGLWLAMVVSAYAPFVNEETGVLDWMEESRYGSS